MKKDNKRILALLMAFALILQYSFSACFISVYAEGENGQPAVTQTASSSSEAKAAAEPAPAPAAETPAPEQAPAAQETRAADPAHEAEPAGFDNSSGQEEATSSDSDSGDADPVEAAAEDGEPSDGNGEPSDEVTEDPAADPEAEAAVEEVAVEETEEDADEEKYPEMTLSKTVNGVTVTLHAEEGILPEGTTLRVSGVNRQDVFNAVEQRLEQEGKTLTDAVAFDITPLDKDGNEIQPRGSVTVTFSGTGLDVGNGGVDVFRVSDSASSVTEMGTSFANANAQQFFTNHFTIYVAGGSASDPNGDGSGPNNTSNRYVLEYGESVTLDSNNGRVSSSWDVSSGSQYVDRNGTIFTNTNSTSNDGNVTVVHYYRNNYLQVFPATEYFYITAKPQHFTATFMLQDAGASGFSQYGDPVDVIRGTSVEAPDMDETKEEGGKTYKFYGWYSEKACETAASFSNIQKNMTYYGKYATDAAIHYVKNTSDSATVPADLESGASITVHLGSATRSGYAFAGWNTKADGSGDSYDAGDAVVMPEDGMTLYAQWDKDAAKTIIRFYYNRNAFDNQVFRSVTNIYKNSRTQLITDVPQNSGSLFLGWSTSRNGAAQYYPGQTYETGSADEVSLYAVWGNISDDNLDIKTLTAKGTEIQYDGHLHRIEGVEEEESSAHPGYVKVGRHQGQFVSYDIYASIRDIKAGGTNAGHYSTPVASRLFAEGLWGTLEATSEYIEVTNTILYITPVELTVTTDDAEKKYDGTELTAGGKVTFKQGEETVEVAFSHDGEAVTLVNGETLNLRTTGSQTDVGDSKNPWELDWGKPEGWGTSASTARSINYRIEKIDEEALGTLTVYNAYTVTFVDDDGTVLKEATEYKEGTPASDIEKPADPAKAADDKNTYTFTGWSPEIADVTEDATYTATYTATPIPAPDDDQPDDTTPTPTPSDDTTPAPAADTDDADDNAGGGGNAGGGNNAGTTAAAAAAAVTADDTADADAEDIEDNETPQTEPAEIEDGETPQSAPESGWALVNLMAMAATAAGAILAFLRKKDEDDPDSTNGTGPKLAGGAAGLASIATFFLTENLSGPMQMTDKWTVLMLGLLAAQAVTAALAKKATDSYEYEDEE